MPKASSVSTSVTQVLVDVGVAEEPVADAAEDHQRLAEEERRPGASFSKTKAESGPAW